MMVTLEKLNRNGLQRIIWEDGRSMVKIAQQAGLSYNCMLKLMNDPKQKRVTSKTIDALSRVLNVDREEMVL